MIIFAIFALLKGTKAELPSYLSVIKTFRQLLIICFINNFTKKEWKNNE